MYIFTDLLQGIFGILDVTDSVIYPKFLTGKQTTTFLEFCVDIDSKGEQKSNGLNEVNRSRLGKYGTKLLTFLDCYVPLGVLSFYL